MTNLNEYSTVELFDKLKDELTKNINGVDNSDLIEKLKSEADSRSDELFNNSYDEAVKNQSNYNEELIFTDENDSLLNNEERELVNSFESDHLAFAKITGSSMKGSGIYSGSIAVYDNGKNVRENDIGIFKLNNNFYIKLLKKTENKIILRSANKDYPDRVISDEDKLTEIGRVLFIINKT